MSFEALNWVRKHSKARGTEMAVLLLIADNMNKAGEAWPGVDRLAREVGRSPRQVLRIIDNLVSLGELERVSHGARVPGRPFRHQPNLYRIPEVGGVYEVTEVTPRTQSDVTVASRQGDTRDPGEVTPRSPESSRELKENQRPADVASCLITPPEQVAGHVRAVRQLLNGQSALASE